MLLRSKKMKGENYPSDTHSLCHKNYDVHYKSLWVCPYRHVGNISDVSVGAHPRVLPPAAAHHPESTNLSDVHYIKTAIQLTGYFARFP